MESSAPFVGRQGEWETLLEAWAAVGAGARQAVLIGGEAGAGKTRLAAEFARWASGRGAAVAYGACDAELAVPYQPFVFALDHLLRAMPDELLEQHREQLTEMAVLLPQIERRIPGLKRGRQRRPRYRAVPLLHRGGCDARTGGRRTSGGDADRRSALGRASDAGALPAPHPVEHRSAAAAGGDVS